MFIVFLILFFFWNDHQCVGMCGGGGGGNGCGDAGRISSYPLRFHAPLSVLTIVGRVFVVLIGAEA